MQEQDFEGDPIERLRAKLYQVVGRLEGQLQDLRDRINQEESDRTSADTSLEDRIADLENA